MAAGLTLLLVPRSHSAMSPKSIATANKARAPPRPPPVDPEDMSDLRTKALYLLYPVPALAELQIDPRNVAEARELLQQMLDEAATLEADVGNPDEHLSDDDDDANDYDSDDSYNDEYVRGERATERIKCHEEASELVALQGFAHHYLAELSRAEPSQTAVATSDNCKRRKTGQGKGKDEPPALKRADHFVNARDRLDYLTLEVSTTGAVGSDVLEIARAQYWLTVARCAEELPPQRVNPHHQGHGTDWGAAFWTRVPDASDERTDGYCGQSDSFLTWVRTAKYRLGQLGRDLESAPHRELDAAEACLGPVLRTYIAYGRHPSPVSIEHWCVEALLADVKAARAALLARGVEHKYRGTPLPLDEDDVHAAKQANKQGARAVHIGRAAEN